MLQRKGTRIELTREDINSEFEEMRKRNIQKISEKLNHFELTTSTEQRIGYIPNQN